MDPRDQGKPTRVEHEIADLDAAVAANLDREITTSDQTASDREQEQELGTILSGLLQRTAHDTS